MLSEQLIHVEAFYVESFCTAGLLVAATPA